MGTPSWLSAIFTKGKELSWLPACFPRGWSPSNSEKGQILLLEEQSSPPLRMRAKLKMTGLLTLKVYQFTLKLKKNILIFIWNNNFPVIFILVTNLLKFKRVIDKIACKYLRTIIADGLAELSRFPCNTQNLSWKKHNYTLLFHFALAKFLQQ